MSAVLVGNVTRGLPGRSHRDRMQILGQHWGSSLSCLRWLAFSLSFPLLPRGHGNETMVWQTGSTPGITTTGTTAFGARPLCQLLLKVKPDTHQQEPISHGKPYAVLSCNKKERKAGQISVIGVRADGRTEFLPGEHVVQARIMGYVCLFMTGCSLGRHRPE